MYLDTKELQTVSAPIHPCLDIWRARVRRARATNGFSLDERELSVNWKMCAIGESQSKYPTIVEYGCRYPYSKIEYPKDERLYELGMKFGFKVSDDNFDACDETLNQIEHRLNEMMIEKH